MSNRGDGWNPYAILVSRHVTEKAMALSQLENATSNRSVARCRSPKVVFRVAPYATKPDIARAVTEVYSERGIKVVKVNTINIKPKACRKRGRRGFRSGYRKAIVTLEPGDRIEDK